MTTRLPRRGWLPLLTLGLLVAIPATARAAETSSRRGLIPVWAFVNGEAPVAHARVAVMVRGKPVRLLGGCVWKRTNAEGVGVLAMRRVPRRFTVVVRGGRAEGMRVRGRERRRVSGYRHTRVIEVNPLTTLVTELRRQHPPLSVRRAQRAVKRYFGVPQWADLGQNLRDLGDEWFSARRYLREVRRHGSIDRLNRRLARRILSGKARRSRAVRRAAPAMVSASGWLDLTAGQLALKAFKYLGGTAVGIGVNQAVGGALGALLELARTSGLSFIPRNDMDVVREQLDAIAEHLTRLEGKIDGVTKAVERSKASALIHQSDEVLGRIDYARDLFAVLASLSPNDPTQKQLAKTVDDAIRDKLLDAPAILNRQLNPTLPIAGNAIKATSQALATERFFDEASSAEVQAVYDYFAIHQLELTVLLTNYWNAHPDTYSVATRKTLIEQIAANVTTTQKSSLKPPVPHGAFFDMRTPQFMWGTENQTVTALTIWTDASASKNTLAQLGFSNWQMPANGDYRTLLEGATGTPRAWLQDQIEPRLDHQLLWASDSVQKYANVQGIFLRVTIFDLATGKEELYEYGGNRSVVACEYSTCNDPRIQRFLRSKSGGLMLLRYLAPGESYWW